MGPNKPVRREAPRRGDDGARTHQRRLGNAQNELHKRRKAVASTFDSGHARSIASRGRGIVSCRSFRGRFVSVGGGGSCSGDGRGDLGGVPTAGEAGRSSLGGETSGDAE